MLRRAKITQKKHKEKNKKEKEKEKIAAPKKPVILYPAIVSRHIFGGGGGGEEQYQACICRSVREITCQACLFHP